MVDSSQWPASFFWITMGSVVILNGKIHDKSLCESIFLYFIRTICVLQLPVEFIKTLCMVWPPNCHSNTLAPLCWDQTLVVHSRPSSVYWVHRSHRLSEQPPFIISSVRCSCCSPALTPILPYHWMWVSTSVCSVSANPLIRCYSFRYLQKFYRYHEMLHEKEMEKTKRLQGSSTTGGPPYWAIFKQASPQLFNIFFVFFVTLALFPVVQSDIALSDKENFPISDKLFVSILCFLTFNMCAMLGSLATSWVQWVRRHYF